MPQLQWEDTIEDGTNKVNREQMRRTASFHMKHGLYKKPEFKFFHSMGIFNFFQGFKSDDLDLGVFHLYWDRDAENTIEYYDPKTGERTNNIKGDWRERWYDPGEKIKPVEMDNPYRPDPVKMAKWWIEAQANITAKAFIKQKQEQEQSSVENEPWNHLPKPQWEN